MTETVYIPPHGNRVAQRGPFIPPLLVVPFVLYNIAAFVFFGGSPLGWTNGEGFLHCGRQALTH